MKLRNNRGAFSEKKLRGVSSRVFPFSQYINKGQIAKNLLELQQPYFISLSKHFEKKEHKKTSAETIEQHLLLLMKTMNTVAPLLALTFLAWTSAKSLSIPDVLRAVEDADDGNFEIVIRRKRTAEFVPSDESHSIDHVSHRHKRSKNDDVDDKKSHKSHQHGHGCCNQCCCSCTGCKKGSGQEDSDDGSDSKKTSNENSDASNNSGSNEDDSGMGTLR